MDECQKNAKTIKILAVLIGLGLLVIGGIKAYNGDKLALAEDGLLGLGVMLLGFGLGMLLTKKNEAEEEKSDDEGL